MSTLLFHIIIYYLLFSLLLWVVVLSLNRTYYRTISRYKTDFHNAELDLELEYGFITPRERDFRKESYLEGWKMFVVGGSFCAPFYIITNIFILSVIAYGFLVHDSSPKEILDPSRVEEELEEKNSRKLMKYEQKLQEWKEEEFRKSHHPKYVWRKEPGVFAR